MNDPKSMHIDDLKKLAEGLNQKYEPRQGYGGACPSCGHCPHCGRGGRQAYPLYPQTPPWWTGNHPWGVQTSGTIPGVTGPHFVSGFTVRGVPPVDGNSASWTQG